MRHVTKMPGATEQLNSNGEFWGIPSLDDGQSTAHLPRGAHFHNEMMRLCEEHPKSKCTQKGEETKE